MQIYFLCIRGRSKPLPYPKIQFQQTDRTVNKNLSLRHIK